MVFINFFTFNMGGTNNMNWGAIIKEEHWKKFFTLDKKSIWVICTQEDQKSSPFMNAVKEHFGVTYKSLIRRSHKIVLPNFQVMLGVFVPKDMADVTPDKKFFHICPFPAITFPFLHKSSILVNWRNISFVGSHLPFNPDDEDDVSLRAKALTTVINSWTENNRKQTLCFILGDLNFRKNQLETYIESKHSFVVTDLTKGMNPTCKMVPGRSPTCSSVSPVTYKDKSDYSDIKEEQDQDTVIEEDKLESEELPPSNSENIEKELIDYISEDIGKCYVVKAKDKSRAPSLCDRVLLATRIGTINSFTVIQHEHITFYPITKSDHNAIFVKVEIKDDDLSGGARGKSVRKYVIIRKTQKCYVLHVEKTTNDKFIMMSKRKVYLKNIKGQYVYKKQ